MVEIPEEKLREWEKLCEEATAGPWAGITRQGSWDWVVFTDHDANIEICQMFHDGTPLNEIGEANTRFIAASRTALPTLLAEVRRLKGQNNG